MAGEEETHRQTDAEIALRLKEEARGYLEQLCKVQDRARLDGFVFQFGTAPDPMSGRYIVTALSVLKPY